MGQLSALFYKNWILYKRSLLGNVLELLIPIFFIFFVLLVRKIEEPTTYTQQSFYTNPLFSYTIEQTNASTAYLKYFNIYAGGVQLDPKLALCLQGTP